MHPALLLPMAPAGAPTSSASAPSDGRAEAALPAAPILVVEDDAELTELLCRRLRDAGFATESTPSGHAALKRLAVGPCALVILDLGLPDLDGTALLSVLRARADPTPVIVLTARDAIEDRVATLAAGADDYVAKPFEPDELLARIRAVLRRHDAQTRDTLRLGGLQLERPRGDVYVRGRRLPLAPREAALLEVLMGSARRVLFREALMRAVFGDEETTPNALEALVSRLRRRLAEVDAGVFIHTIRGVGYIVTDEDPTT
jgi:two-component system, OmpR family, response regulator